MARLVGARHQFEMQFRRPVLRQRKAADREGKVLFVDASTLFKRGRNQNTLEDEHRERIEQLYAAFAAEEGLAHVATLDELAASDFDLNGWHWAAGGGIRFAVNEEERINLRFDTGVTAEGTNYYLAIGEAF